MTQLVELVEEELQDEESLLEELQSMAEEDEELQDEESLLEELQSMAEALHDCILINVLVRKRARRALISSFL